MEPRAKITKTIQNLLLFDTFILLKVFKSKTHHFWIHACWICIISVVYTLRELFWSGGSWKKKKKRGEVNKAELV